MTLKVFAGILVVVIALAVVFAVHKPTSKPTNSNPPTDSSKPVGNNNLSNDNVESEICGVDPVQIKVRKTFGDREYLLYLRNSMNIYLDGKKNYLESGVIEVNKTAGGKCKKILGIADPEDIVAKNNPYEILYKNGNIYVLVVDHLGSGSGEGTAKLLMSGDGGSEWKLMSCFYYTPETNPGLEALIIDVPKTVKSKNCSDFVLTAGKLIP
jgi:hypothetical protein